MAANIGRHSCSLLLQLTTKLPLTGVAVGVGVNVAVAVGVEVKVGVGVKVNVGVRVGVEVLVGGGWVAVGGNVAVSVSVPLWHAASHKASSEIANRFNISAITPGNTKRTEDFSVRFVASITLLTLEPVIAQAFLPLSDRSGAAKI